MAIITGTGTVMGGRIGKTRGSGGKSCRGRRRNRKSGIVESRNNGIQEKARIDGRSLLSKLGFKMLILFGSKIEIAASLPLLAMTLIF